MKAWLYRKYWLIRRAPIVSYWRSGRMRTYWRFTWYGLRYGSPYGWTPRWRRWLRDHTNA